MALTTVKSIEQALSLVDEKKQSLKKAFEELESFPSLNLAWTDMDSYLSGVQSELLDKLSALQALKPSKTRKRKRKRDHEKRKDPFVSELVPARPQLKSLCEKMDALGLRKYVIDRPKERTRIRAELADACRHAPDAGSIVLDALQGFWDEKRLGSRLRTACVVLLEELMRAGVEIRAEVRKRAKAVAEEWRAKMAEISSGTGGEGDEEGWVLESLGYLQLLASYKLLIDDGFDANDLVDHVVLSARYPQTVHLCRVLGLESKISDVVQRLVSTGKQLEALEFIFEFELMDEFPPVPLLKACMMDSEQFVQKASKSGKSSGQNDAAKKEISALKSVIKCIEDHGLESQYPKDEMLMRIKKLIKEKTHMKRPVSDPVPKHPPKIPKHTGSKRPKAAAGPSASNRKLHGNSVVHPSRPSSVKRADLFPNHAASFLSSASGVYGTTGNLVAVSPYMGPTVDLYGVQGASLGFPGNLNPSMSNSYASEIHAQPVYYNGALAYGGYDDVPSHYPPVYYPQ